MLDLGRRYEQIPGEVLAAVGPRQHHIRGSEVEANGEGFNTLQPAFGFKAGGLGPDNRTGLYVGDS